MATGPAREAWWVFYLDGKEWNPNLARSWRHSPMEWTCNEKSQVGDYALLYVTKPVSSFTAIFRVASNAYENQDGDYYQPWWCRVKFTALLKRPLSFLEMSADENLRSEWGLIRGQFQAPAGTSPRIPDEILSMLAWKIPEVDRLTDGASVWLINRRLQNARSISKKPE